MSTTNKLASQMPGVLKEAADHMRKLANQNVDLLQENGELKSELRIMKLARRMEERGIEPTLDFDTKVASLREVGDEKLSVIEQAVELAPGGFNLGRLGGGEESSDKVAGDESPSGDSLEHFVLSQQAYT